ncbi:hypothetical protein [Streptomyces hokutonensis]|uniref:hypothetical protein n=1 Tax=Streptomyces hokutonensis TaxID=1306990 RepID=UPI0033CA5122
MTDLHCSGMCVQSSTSSRLEVKKRRLRCLALAGMALQVFIEGRTLKPDGRGLDRILAFKRAQSVFTDVIRLSVSLRGESKVKWARLPSAVRKPKAIMTAAVGPLSLAEIPSGPRIAAALVRRVDEADQAVMDGR